jgi:hypothetical protein
LRRIVVIQLIPREELSKFDLAIGIKKFAGRVKEGVVEGEQITTLTPISVENCRPHIGSKKPVYTKSSFKNS